MRLSACQTRQAWSLLPNAAPKGCHFSSSYVFRSLHTSGLDIGALPFCSGNISDTDSQHAKVCEGDSALPSFFLRFHRASQAVLITSPDFAEESPFCMRHFGQHRAHHRSIDGRCAGNCSSLLSYTNTQHWIDTIPAGLTHLKLQGEEFEFRVSPEPGSLEKVKALLHHDHVQAIHYRSGKSHTSQSLQ